VALSTTCIKNVKFKIAKKGQIVQYLEYLPNLGRAKPSTGSHAVKQAAGWT